MTFDPNDFMLNLKGKKYLPVAPRLAWFRDEHPDASVTTECSYADEANGVYRFRASVSIPGKSGGAVIATGHGMATRKEFPSGPAEKAESKAVGRALLFLGYGTLNAQELDDDDEPLSESPRDPRQHPPASTATRNGNGRTTTVHEPTAAEATREPATLGLARHMLELLQADPAALAGMDAAVKAKGKEFMGRELEHLSHQDEGWLKDGIARLEKARTDKALASV